jgi:hypothetical protein
MKLTEKSRGCESFPQHASRLGRRSGQGRRRGSRRVPPRAVRGCGLRGGLAVDSGGHGCGRRRHVGHHGRVRVVHESQWATDRQTIEAGHGGCGRRGGHPRDHRRPGPARPQPKLRTLRAVLRESGGRSLGDTFHWFAAYGLGSSASVAIQAIAIVLLLALQLGILLLLTRTCLRQARYRSGAGASSQPGERPLVPGLLVWVVAVPLALGGGGGIVRTYQRWSGPVVPQTSRAPIRHPRQPRPARRRRHPERWKRGVGEGGLEPPRPFGHRNLNPARLPIPPLARATGTR